MKRLLALGLAILLLAGCASESLTIETLDKERDFGAFHASAPTVAEANRAYALVQAALSCYPGGFPEQWGQVNILLVRDLTGEEQFTGGYGTADFQGFNQSADVFVGTERKPVAFEKPAKGRGSLLLGAGNPFQIVGRTKAKTHRFARFASGTIRQNIYDFIKLQCV